MEEESATSLAIQEHQMISVAANWNDSEYYQNINGGVDPNYQAFMRVMMWRRDLARAILASGGNPALQYKQIEVLAEANKELRKILGL